MLIVILRSIGRIFNSYRHIIENLGRAQFQRIYPLMGRIISPLATRNLATLFDVVFTVKLFHDTPQWP
ncbi:hypothetical protein CEXT_764771, partial [Caerostris extrusa]